MNLVTTDPVADLLTRLRNATALNKTEISLPYSKLKFNLLKILKESGFIIDTKVAKGEGATIRVILRDEEAAPSRPILGLKRLSRPGRRLYTTSRDIPTVRQGRGLVVMSTSQGLMSGHRAKARHLGGELICEVW